MTCKIAQDIIVAVESVLNPNTGTDARFVSFSGLTDKREHVAVIYAGASIQTDTPLVRIHSECLTGDIFASRRCDCGPQLRYAKETFEQDGGIILYLRQEGRGIGLYQKLKAYALQNKGFDTFEANRLLGHGEDERDFSVAADMLGALDYQSCRLLSNNPEKAKSLQKSGINVTEIIPLPVFSTPENMNYIHAKQKRGHLKES